MQTERIIVDRNGREIVSYQDPHFLLEVWSGKEEGMNSLRLPVHWHSEFEFAVVLEGTLTYHFQGFSLVLKKGDCIFVNSDCIHSVESEPGNGAEMFTVAFPFSFLFKDPGKYLEREYLFPVLNSGIRGIRIDEELPYGKQIHRILRQIYELENEIEGYELLVSSPVYEMWWLLLKYIEKNDEEHAHEAGHIAGKESETTKKALAYIYANYDRKILVEDIAKAANVSRTTCFRIFQNDFGKTPLDILSEYRLTIAKRLLAGENSVTEIALSCGYSSLSYFSKQFHRYFGMSPHAYQKYIRKERKNVL